MPFKFPRSRASALLIGACAVAVMAAPAAARSAPAEAAASTGMPDSAAASPDALAVLAEQVAIPYEQFTLDNGLRVLVHTDRKAPVVALSVYYNVGSKHEPAGKAGFAHLFEHLMFNGSENADGDFFEPMQQMGATGLNGTTWYDRTNYFETVPVGALEKALYLESDRMGYLLGAVTQEKLDNQRGVVQNEKRQGDNKPFGMVQYVQTAALFPADHPYGHTTIGSMADLEAARMEDVRAWFRQHYGPNNAVLALAGDIDVATARALVEKYFGPIPRGPATEPLAVAIPTLPARKDETITDTVSTTRFYRDWIAPGLDDPDAVPLAIGASVLGGLASSRLDNILVRDEQLATRVSADLQNFAQMSQFEVSVDVRDGVDADVVSRRLDAIIAELIAEGPTEAEVRRVSTQAIASYVKGLETVGSKASVLAEGLLYSEDPAQYRSELDAYAKATPAEVRAALQRWIARPVYALTVTPGPRQAFDDPSATREVARAAERPGKPLVRVAREPAPDIGPVDSLTFPDVERASLSNGIELVYARRPSVPMTLVSLSLDAGYAADPEGRAGTAELTTALLNQGTGELSSRAIAERQEELGASIGAGSSMDRTSVGLSALSTNLAPSLDLFADIVLRPAFAPSEVERLKAQQLAGIRSELTNPSAIAVRLLMPALYGQESPYGVPGTGSGDPAVVAGLDRDDLIGFHRAWFRPDKARIFVVSDLPLADIRSALEQRFGAWQGSGPAGAKAFAGSKAEGGSRILLVDRPGSPQSQIVAGQLLDLTGRDEHLALSGATQVLGGSFLSRINMDLRETKGWSYGVRAGIGAFEGPMHYWISAPVQADRTGDSIAALIANHKAFLTSEGVTEAELERNRNGDIRELPGAFQTARAVMGALQANDLFGRADNYYEGLPDRIRAHTTAALDRAARTAIRPDEFLWIVVGDATSVRPQLEQLGLPVELVDAE